MHSSTMASKGTIILILQVLIHGYLCNEELSDSNPSNMVLGRETLEDPTNNKFKTLAEKSFSFFIESTQLSSDLNLIEVKHVTTQIVSGIITRIRFTVSSETNQLVYSCFTKIFEVRWLNKSDTSISCQNLINPRNKQRKDPKHQIYMTMAQESLTKYPDVSKKYMVVVEVRSVTEQVLDGFRTNILFDAYNTRNGLYFNCHANILEQYWLNKTKTVTRCHTKYDLTNNRYYSTYKIEDPRVPEYKTMAEAALSEHPNNLPNYKVTKVLKVLSKAVDGVSLSIYFLADSGTGRYIRCNAKVWVRSEIKKTDILDVKCKYLVTIH